MSKSVYVLMGDEGVVHVYTNSNAIFNECKRWHNEHRTDWVVESSFYDWVIYKDKYHIDPEDDSDDYEQAWNDYIEEQFESGTWGNYAWYESSLD